MSTESILHFRIAVYTLLNGMPYFYSNWLYLIFPTVLAVNFGVTESSQIAIYAGLLYTITYVGTCGSCFIWPFAVKHISKRNIILLASVMTGVITMLSGVGGSFCVFFAGRLLAGAFNVSPTCKDLLFQVCKGHMRQVALNIAAVVSLVTSLLTPVFGMMLYEQLGRNLSETLFWVGFMYLAVASLFLIFYYLIPFEERLITEDSDPDHQPLTSPAHFEDAEPVTVEVHGVRKLKTRSYREVIYWCFNYPRLRNLILINAIALAVYSADFMITVLLFEMPWEDQGYGVAPQTLSQVVAVSVVFAGVILLILPSICPSTLGYAATMRTFITVFALTIIATPALRDVLQTDNSQPHRWLAYLIIVFKNCSNVKLFAPFIYYLLNIQTNRFTRTLINTVSFLTSMIFTVLAVNLLVPTFGFLMYNPFFTRFAPWNKYPLFIVLLALQMVCLAFATREQKAEEERYNMMI